MKSLLAILPLAVVAVTQDILQIPLQSVSSPARPLTFESIPLLGFGTWNIKGNNISDVVSLAIQTGYRHIDCADAYGNEKEVGKGIADGLLKTGLSREDLWITSKLWNNNHDPSRVEKAIDTSLRKLGLDYLDLYHIHWPVTSKKSGHGNKINYLDAWEAMTTLVPKNKTRYIGVCNFSPRQLETLLNHTHTPPAVHQMELHPYLQQPEYLAFHRNHSIHVTAYSPFGGTNPTYKKKSSLTSFLSSFSTNKKKAPTPLLKNDVLHRIADARGCTAAQVALKFGMLRGTSIIPKSVHKNYIEENFRAGECELQKSDWDELEELGDEHWRYSSPGGWGVKGLFEGLEDDDGKHNSAWWWSKE